MMSGGPRGPLHRPLPSLTPSPRRGAAGGGALGPFTTPDDLGPTGAMRRARGGRSWSIGRGCGSPGVAGRSGAGRDAGRGVR